MKPTRNMSPKEYARWLNETANLPYEEACKMAGYDPIHEFRIAAIQFLGTVLVIAIVVLVLAYAPEAITAEQPQRVEDAFLSCINGRGMVINGEVWVCTPSGVKGLQ